MGERAYEHSDLERTMSGEFGYPVRIRDIYGEDVAQRIAGRMVGLSCWFEVMPLPDGWWRFTFKPEATSLVDTIIRESLHEIES